MELVTNGKSNQVALDFSDSSKEEEEVFASLTPAPPRKSTDSLSVPANGAISRNTASPMPARTIKLATKSAPKSSADQPAQFAPAKTAPPTKPTSNPKQPQLPAWTAEEDRILRNNEIGPEYNAIIKRRGRAAVKIRQTELNEADIVDSD